MLQLEIPLETVCRAARLAAEANVPVILDPAPAVPLPRGLLADATYLTPNEHEAERLTGIAVCDKASALRAAQKLRGEGARNVIVTMGAKGALLVTKDEQTLISAPTVDAVDSTAAGDAFNGGLAWALARGLPLEEAVRQACLAGALATTRIGAQSSMPTRIELQCFTDSGDRAS
jgi:ribokinase